MKVIPADLDGILVIEPQVFADERGFFLETWSLERYRDAGLPTAFVQDNVSRSVRGTLRGLHLQHPHGQGKLIQAIDGELFDVAVDVRRDSPTRGQWIAVTLSSTNHRQIYVPPGFAHGFCVTSESALFSYKCTDYYRPETELCIAWNDPDIGIEWPVTDPTLSDRDAAAPRLAEIPADRLPA